MRKRRMRRFLVTVEEIDVEPDPTDIHHQEPAPLQTRPRPWWSTPVQQREKRIAERRAKAKVEAKKKAKGNKSENL